jgi:hypothetical protein
MGSDTSIQASSNRVLKEWAAIVEAIGQDSSSSGIMNDQRKN